MELRHLRYFVAVAEELHFRRAAERLHVAQPAVSEQIRKLEAELGVRLFDRDQRRVELTAPGSAMLDEARRTLAQADRAREAAQRAQRQAIGRLRLGYLVDAVPRDLPRALGAFAGHMASTEVELRCDDTRRLLGDVRDGTLDAAIVCLPAPVVGMRVTRLGRERAVAAVRDSHPLASAPAVSLAALQETEIIQLPREINPAFHDGILSACSDAGVSPALSGGGERTVGDALLSVIAGRGLALVPESAAARHALPGVRFKPLNPDAPVCDIALVSRTDDTSLALGTLVRALVHAARRAAAAPAPRIAAAASAAPAPLAAA